MTHNAVIPSISALMESLKAIDLCLTRPFHGPNIIEKLKHIRKIVFKVPDGQGRQFRVQETLKDRLLHTV